MEQQRALHLSADHVRSAEIGLPQIRDTQVCCFKARSAEVGSGKGRARVRLVGLIELLADPTIRHRWQAGMVERVVAQVVSFGDDALDNRRIRVGELTGHDVQIAAVGEVLVRGSCLFVRCHNQPSATAKAIDGDGWFHTSDAGTLDADGFLRIVDRKKELIVTAGGKKVAPQLIEGLLQEDPLASQACVYGDRKPYLVALLTFDWPAVMRWTEQRHIAGADATMRALIGSSELRAHLDAHISRDNVRLARFEQIKYYDVLPGDFTVDNGLFTLALKTRRRAVYARYFAHYERLYRTASEAPDDSKTAVDELAALYTSASTGT